MADMREICVCGHPVPRHELVGTEYARCRLWEASTPCNCQEAARVALRVSHHDQGRFKRTSRGSESPHPLTGAIAHIEADHIEWLVFNCDLCSSEVIDGSLRALAVDNNGHPMFPVSPAVKLDTGHHVLVCVDCWDDLEAETMDDATTT